MADKANSYWRQYCEIPQHYLELFSADVGFQVNVIDLVL